MTEQLSEHTLYSVEELIDILKVTEDLEEYPFDYGPSTGVSLVAKPDQIGDKLFLKLGDAKYALTRDAAEQIYDATKVFKTSAELIDNVPFELTSPIVNWHLANRGGSMKALLKDNKVVSFCKPSVEVYSSVEILEAIIDTLRKEYGWDEILVQNPYHDLSLTQYTLLLPQLSEQLDNGDVLSAAITVTNSILAKEQLVIWGGATRGYHFNSMISEKTIEKWNRRQVKTTDMDDIMAGEESYDVFDWIHTATISVASNISNDVMRVKGLKNHEVGSHAGTFLNSIFAKYAVPTKLGGFIRESFSEQEGNSIYDLWNAVTESANHDELEGKPKNIRKLMQVGGALAAHPYKCDNCHRVNEDLE